MTPPARRAAGEGRRSARRRRSIKTGARPFRRVLVANRGEIALRILRACRELGIETVAVYSDADRRARHVLAADQAVRIGPAPAAESYLRADRIVAAALETGAEAIHPGYGFLSEQAPFAEACVTAGLTFVGPEALTLAGLGDKLAARRAASAVGVPVVPGTLEPARAGDATALSALTEAAERIGWPLLVKAAAGGGGRGMRRVDRPADLADALGMASHEAEAAFGDGTVYLERLVEGARHVEVQLLGDASGHVVAIGERDCSIQRRHQKLVEEAPAPGLDAERRASLHGHAVEVARAVGLRNAATAEFLMEPNGSFWFLEVNARLQVEHGVTELTTGLDLVREQLWIAAGRPLSAPVLAAAASAVEPASHAIEVRLSAEDPALAFAPTPGTITAWREPGGPGVRVDTWIEPGTRIGSDYDPLLAKILVVAEDRPAALARLRRALDELEVGGLQTTLPFDRWLLEQPAFLSAELATDFVDRYWIPGPIQAAAAQAAALLAVAAERERSGTDGLAGAASGATEGWPGRNPSLTDAPSQGSVGDGGSEAPAGGSAWRAAARREAVRGLPR